MDEKKVREAIELLKEEIHVLEELESHIDIIEKQKKKHIGLYNTAIEALEKQLPKKPVLKRKAYGGIIVCPICEASDSGKYCRYCGQKLDWSE